MINSPGWQARARHGVALARHAVALALALATLTALPVLGQTAEPSPIVASGTDPDGAQDLAAGRARGFAAAPHFTCPACTGFIELHAEAITEATVVRVDVDNRAAVQLSNLPVVQASQLFHRLLTDGSLREAIADADIVVVNVGHNDTPWNRFDNPCDASDPTATDTQWSMITDECVRSLLGDCRRTLDEIFSQIDFLRGWHDAGQGLGPLRVASLNILSLDEALELAGARTA